ncbi:Zinc finger CCHC-type [Arabidopsis suecica]|uniref:Zinc finger CCHC-type n=1 Tax=Arabidopsis suecica TaxID=45249 RepID=A0A8T1ZHT8_ARASU|nr:Zinc finger CCHC-type [Arabidopsis suecica]
MSFAMFEEQKLHRRGDYTLWKTRIRAHLGVLGLMEALKIEEEDGNKYVKIAEDEKLSANLSPGLEEKNKKARSMIILSVGDKILRKIMKEETAAGMLQVLDKYYMTTSLVRRFYLREKLHSFRMNERKSVMENVDEFQRLIDELSNAKVEISDEDQAIFLLVSLPEQFDEVRDTVTYGKTSLTAKLHGIGSGCVEAKHASSSTICALPNLNRTLLLRFQILFSGNRDSVALPSDSGRFRFRFRFRSGNRSSGEASVQRSLTVNEVIDAALSKEMELGESYRGYDKKYRERSRTRIEVEKFDGRGDYILWKTRILARFEILDLMEALKIEEEDGNKSVGTGLEEKKRKARSMIIQSIENQDLRKKIMKEDTAAGMFQVLDKLYITRSSTSRTYLQYKLCSFRMNESQFIEENIDEFERLVDDLSNAKVSISDEDQVIRLLISLPKRFDDLRDVLTYGRTSLTLDEVICAVLSKELKFGSKGTAEELHVRGRSISRDRSKSKGEKGACWICGEDGHYKNDCPNKEHTYGKGETYVTRRNTHAALWETLFGANVSH